jgi:hypothetical protein
MKRVCKCGVIIDNPEDDICYFHKQLELPAAERDIEEVRIMAGSQVFATHWRPKT